MKTSFLHAALAAFLAGSLSLTAAAADRTITSSSGDEHVVGSFRYEIDGAKSGDRILFQDDIQSITLNGTATSSANSLAIVGNDGLPSISGHNQYKIIRLNGGGSSMVSSLTFLDGRSNGETVGLGDSLAYGAGLTMNAGRIDNTVFRRNTAEASGGNLSSAGNASAGAGVGGAAVYIWNGNVSSSVFQDNVARATGGTVTSSDSLASGDVYGGTLYFGNAGNIHNSFFQDNVVEIKAGTANGLTDAESCANLFGGVVYLPTGQVSNSTFLGNSTTGIGGTAIATAAGSKADASVLLQGGALYTSNGYVSDLLFVGNSLHASGGRAEAEAWANADVNAFGGALYFRDTDNWVVDSTLIGNSVTAENDGIAVQNGIESRGAVNALGGAIFVENSSGNDDYTELVLVANSKKKTVIADNSANGTASGVHFGRGDYLQTETGYFGDSKQASILWILAEKNGEVRLLDPLTVEAYNKDAGAEFYLQAYGGGTLTWGGKNIVDANGGAWINTGDFSGNLGDEAKITIILQRDFTLTTTANIDYRTGSATDAYATASTTNPDGNKNPLVVNLFDGTTLKFDTRRDENLAMFDFTGASNANQDSIFNQGNGIELGTAIDPTRQLLDIDKDYRLAAGIGPGDVDWAVNDGFQNGLGVSKIYGRGDHELWVSVDYQSPFGDAVRSNANTWNAAGSLNELTNAQTVFGDYFLDDARVAAITQNLHTVTPEYATSRMVASRRAVAALSDSASYQYFRDADNEISACGPCDPRVRFGKPSKFRLWGGYVGDFGRMDAHDGFEAYKTDLNGILIGGDRQVGQTGRIGFYGGYMSERMSFRSINSGVESDGFQLGLLARKQFGRFSLLGDLGYAHFDNDGWRMLGPYGAMASFDQDFLAAGLGLEYEIVRNQNRIVPFARLRYIYGKQTGLTESGNSGTETTLDALEGSGFASSLGTEFSRRIVRQGMSWVPRVSVAWVHEFGDVDFATGSVYNFGATNRFRLGSAKDDRDRFRLGTDLRADLDKRWSLVLGYTLDVSSHTTLHGVAAGAEYRF